VLNQEDLRTIIGATAYDNDGDKIGKVGQVYYDDDTDQPKWVTVNTGLFGTHESFAPLQGASVSNDRVTLAYDKAKVKDAPNVGDDGHLSPQEEQRLYEYYSLDYGTSDYRESGYATTGETVTGGRGTAGYDGGADRADRTDRVSDVERSAGHDTSGPNTDDAMTRSEERLKVGTETREAGRARLRKHVVTEHQQVTVPVSHEEVVVEREEITDANRGDAYDGPAISEEEHEVVLREERPVVDKEAVAVERVRLGTETVRETETVGGEVRKEEIEIDGDVRDRDRDRDRDRRR
jgi:uncharacterized protein (TIGR02271 family)